MKACWLEGIDPSKLRGPRGEAICRRFVGTCAKAGVPADLDFARVNDWLTRQDKTLGIIGALESAWVGLSRVAGQDVLAEMYKDAPTVTATPREEVLIATPHRVKRKAKRGTIPPTAKVFVGGGALPFS